MPKLYFSSARKVLVERMVGEGQSEEMERAGFWQMNLSLFEH